MTSLLESGRAISFGATTLLATYIGAYYGSVAQFQEFHVQGPTLAAVPRPYYGEMENWWGRTRVRGFFTPMHWVDREIRQSVWQQ